MPDAIALLGRAMLSAIFIWGGFGKLMAAGATQAYIAKSGLPVPELACAVAVFVELGVGLALLLGLLTRVAALVLAVWCIVTAALFHSDTRQPGDDDPVAEERRHGRRHALRGGVRRRRVQPGRAVHPPPRRRSRRRRRPVYVVKGEGRRPPKRPPKATRIDTEWCGAQISLAYFVAVWLTQFVARSRAAFLDVSSLNFGGIARCRHFFYAAFGAAQGGRGDRRQAKPHAVSAAIMCAGGSPSPPAPAPAAARSPAPAGAAGPPRRHRPGPPAPGSRAGAMHPDLVRAAGRGRSSSQVRPPDRGRAPASRCAAVPRRVGHHAPPRRSVAWRAAASPPARPLAAAHHGPVGLAARPAANAACACVQRRPAQRHHQAAGRVGVQPMRQPRPVAAARQRRRTSPPRSGHRAGRHAPAGPAGLSSTTKRASWNRMAARHRPPR